MPGIAGGDLGGFGSAPRGSNLDKGGFGSAPRVRNWVVLVPPYREHNARVVLVPPHGMRDDGTPAGKTVPIARRDCALSCALPMLSILQARPAPMDPCENTHGDWPCCAIT